MKNNILLKASVYGIILLFVGTSVLSSISGREITTSDSNFLNQISNEQTNAINNLNPPKTLGSTDGLVCYWNFNEGHGFIAHDSSGNGNNGHIYFATWTTGKCGKALQIKGPSSIGIPSSFESAISTTYTISAWIKWYGPTGADCIIFDGRGGPSTGDGFDIYVHKGDNHLRLWNNNNNGALVISKSTIPIRTWTFVVGVYNLSSSSMSLYINGVIDNTNTTTLPFMPSGSAVIGNSHFEYNAPFNGVVDEIRIYNRALSQTEITNLYTVLLDSSMKGGFGLKLKIKNQGTADASNVEWQIQVTGGIFGRINVDKSGTINTIAKGASATVRTGMFFGFGKIQITIKIGDEIITTSGRQFFTYTKLSK